MPSNTDQNLRPDYDQEIQAIVDYVLIIRWSPPKLGKLLISVC
jgi:hypothetical protein